MLCSLPAIYLGPSYGGSGGKASVYNEGDWGSIPRSGRFPWRRKWQSTPVLLPGKSHGQRSLVGYSPWGRKELERTERLHFHFQTMVEVMKIMVTSFKRSHACTAILSAPNPAGGQHWPTPPLETPGHSQASLVSFLWSHCSFLLGPRHKVLFVPSKSLFPSPV